MPQVFLSYRMDDSAHAAIAIADRLAADFDVFRDRDSLTLGALYPRRIRRALERSDVVLAVIGPAWLDRRLDQHDDWVRTELRMAFEREIPVVPVLLDDTPLPTPTELPGDLGSLSLSNYWRVRSESFDSDVRGLADGIHRTLGSTAPPQSPPGNTQYNIAHGGTVIANQGGTQHIHGRNPR